MHLPKAESLRTRDHRRSFEIRRGLPALGQARRTLWLLWLMACLSMAGCRTGPEALQRDRQILAGHTVHETRMSNRAENGFVPSGVWRICGPRSTLYLAGTCHLITPNQIPFPSPFYAAYQDSEEVYLEVVEGSSVVAQTRLLFKTLHWLKSHRAEMVCPPGQTLASYLSPETIQALKLFYGQKSYLKRETMTPLFLVFLAQAESMGTQYKNSGGVDDFFEALARKDGKPARALDDSSVEDLALLVLDEMLLDIKLEIGRRGADAVVQEEVLGSGEEVEETDWRTGDLAALEEEIEETKAEAPELYEKLGPERNRKWLAKLKAALGGQKNVMVLVGAAHLGGSEGLLQLLRNEGFDPEQMYGIDPVANTVGPFGENATRK